MLSPFSHGILALAVALTGGSQEAKREDPDVFVEAKGSWSGQVTLRGKPVLRAEVSLLRWGPRYRNSESGSWNFSESARSGIEGRFSLPALEPGRYQLEGWALGVGYGTRVLDILPDSIPDLSLELDQELGALVGRVVLPADQKPEDIRLVTTPYYGSCRLRPDGSFFLGGLRPKEHTLRIAWRPKGPGERVGEWVYDKVKRVPLPWLDPDPVFRFEVEPGQALAKTIDLVAPAPHRVEGRVTVDGVPPRPILPMLRCGNALELRKWNVMYLEDEHDRVISMGKIAPDGSFAVRSQVAGDYRLSCRLRMESGFVDLSSPVRLEGPKQSWKLSLETSYLRLSADRSGLKFLEWRQKRRDGSELCGDLRKVSEKGERPVFRLFSGTNELFGARGNALGQVHLTPGQSTDW